MHKTWQGHTISKNNNKCAEKKNSIEISHYRNLYSNISLYINQKLVIEICLYSYTTILCCKHQGTHLTCIVSPDKFLFIWSQCSLKTLQFCISTLHINNCF